MSSTLDQDMPQIYQENSANVKKQKRKSKSGMTAFTSSARKSKMGSDEIDGWSIEGKKFVCELFNEIKQDEQSGVHKKWEDVYKRMCKATKQDKAKAWMMMTTSRCHLKWTQTCCTWKFNVAFNTCQ
jgi:hypothetical protein